MLDFVSILFTERWKESQTGNMNHFGKDAEMEYSKRVSLWRIRFFLGMIAAINIVLWIPFWIYQGAIVGVIMFIVAWLSAGLCWGLHFSREKGEAVIRLVDKWAELRPIIRKACCRVGKQTVTSEAIMRSLQGYLRSEVFKVLQAEAEGNESKAKKHKGTFDEALNLGIYLGFSITRKDFFTDPDAALVRPRAEGVTFRKV